MSGLFTDAGRGGTRKGMENEMMKQGRICLLDLVLTTTCAHHGFNLMMASPCVKFLSDVGIQHRNLLQLFHTYFEI